MLRLLPVILAALFLAAHFLHGGNLVGVAVSLLFPCLLFFRTRWAVRAVQVILLLGAAEWMRRLFELKRIYAADGRPATRMIFILATVALLTAAAALVFRTSLLRKRFGLDAPSA